MTKNYDSGADAFAAMQEAQVGGDESEVVNASEGGLSIETTEKAGARVATSLEQMETPAQVLEGGSINNKTEPILELKSVGKPVRTPEVIMHERLEISEIQQDIQERLKGQVPVTVEIPAGETAVEPIPKNEKPVESAFDRSIREKTMMSIHARERYERKRASMSMFEKGKERVSEFFVDAKEKIFPKKYPEEIEWRPGRNKEIEDKEKIEKGKKDARKYLENNFGSASAYDI